MPLLPSGCCGLLSTQSASYCVAFYTFLYYLVTLTISGLGMVGVEHHRALVEATGQQQLPTVDSMTLGLLVVMLILSTIGIVSVVLLGLGLSQKRPRLLLPVICTLSATVIADLTAVIVSITQDIIGQHLVDDMTVAFLLVDVTTMTVNLWCVISLLSQYRMFKAGDGELSDHSSSFQMPLTVTPGHSATGVAAASLVLGGQSHLTSSCRPADGGDSPQNGCYRPPTDV